MSNKLIEFPIITDTCGYCGFDSSEHEQHYCDGFGHSRKESGEVIASGCANCRNGYYCERRDELEKETQE